MFRLGFTSYDPYELEEDLEVYVYRNLNNLSRNWISALDERCVLGCCRFRGIIAEVPLFNVSKKLLSDSKVANSID